MRAWPLLLFALFLLPRAFAAEFILLANDGAAGDRFGHALAAANDIVVVGAPGADVNGEDGAGAVYVFERVGSAWSQVAKLVALDASADAAFGSALSLCDEQLLIGAPSADGTGAVYVFERQGGDWVQTWRLAAPETQGGEQFGASVASNAERLLIGAPRAVDTPGTPPDFQQGAAYVFERQGQAWRMTAKLVSNNAAFLDLFGSAVALDGARAAVAAVGQSDYAGGVYVFERIAADNWVQLEFHAPGPYTNGSSVGQAVAFENGLLAIGAPYSDDGVKIFSGAVFLAGGETGVLTANEWSGGAAFGNALALDGDRLLVGAANVGRAHLFQRGASGWIEADAFPPAAAGSGYASAVALAGNAAVAGHGRATVAGTTERGAVYVYQ